MQSLSSWIAVSDISMLPGLAGGAAAVAVARHALAARAGWCVGVADADFEQLNTPRK